MQPIPAQHAITWLKQHGYQPKQLIPIAGYTNHVFKIIGAQHPKRSIIRLANHQLSAHLCPLAHQATLIIERHEQAAALGLAPKLLASDPAQGIMWLNYVGEPRTVQKADAPALQTLLQHLHESGLNWQTAQEPADVASLEHLHQLHEQAAMQPTQSHLCTISAHLLQLAERRAYAEWQAQPVHSDLNPGNCLHDGERWWLIDWDFATAKAGIWDYASLIVENQWQGSAAEAFMPLFKPEDLSWFCCNFALLSYAWHQQRGTALMAQQWQQINYWQAQLT